MRSATRDKLGKDKVRLAFVHTLPCAARGVKGSPCGGRITAHHAGTHGISQRADDDTAIPLCQAHHDRGRKFSVHTLGKNFYEHHGLDRERVIAETQKLFLERAA